MMWGPGLVDKYTILVAAGAALVVAAIGLQVRFKDVGWEGPEGKGKILGGVVGIVFIVTGLALGNGKPGSATTTTTTTTGGTVTSVPVNPSSAPTTTSTTSTTTTAPARTVARFDKPTAGARVSERGGVIAGGPVAHLVSGESLWLLDYDGGYTVDQTALVQNGRWSATSAPLGVAGDALPYNLAVVLVRASPSCAAALADATNKGDSTVPALPAGCSQLDTVTVVVDRR